MPKFLLTAFEPYDRWSENSSWAALADLTHWYDGPAELVTRRYPVDLTAMSSRLRADLLAGFDFALHLGQSPGSPSIKIEAVGLNVRSDGSPLIPGAAEAYRTSAPIQQIAVKLTEAGIPCVMSHHAGTYLCNAAMYLSCHYSHALALPTRSLFLHLPLTPAQAAKDGGTAASMSTSMASAAIAIAIEAMRGQPVPQTSNA